MNIQRDPDVILSAWLHEGPTRLPDATRRAIAVSTRTTRQTRVPSRLPWRAPTLNGMTRYALTAVVVVALVVGGLYLLRPSADRSGGVGGPASPSPSASPASSGPPSPAASIPAMTQAFRSPTFGYSIRYPAGWKVTPTFKDGLTADGADHFDSVDGLQLFRALSVVVPDGMVVDDWIARNLTQSSVVTCAPPRNTLDPVTIDGHDGRLRGFCGAPPATEIEASVVIGNRVYLLTLFDYREGDGLANEDEIRAVFDAFTATIKLDPQSARGLPSPSPS